MQTIKPIQWEVNFSFAERSDATARNLFPVEMPCAEGGQHTLVARNRALIEGYYRSLWNCDEQGRAAEFLSQEVAFCFSTGVRAQGIPALLAFIQWHKAAFPDFGTRVDSLVCEGQAVTARLLHSGTHRGSVFGEQATGHHVEFGSVTLFGIADGRIRDIWSLSDTYRLRQQIGA